jgi:hypothetical protein
MVVVNPHRCLRRGVGQQFGGHSLVLGQDKVDATEDVRRPWRKVAEIPDRRSDNVEARE